MSKNKLVVVASYLGRTGSSALMGTLSKAGFDIGKSLKRSGDINNPKGYFELTTQDGLIKNFFPEYYKPRGPTSTAVDRAPDTNAEIEAIFNTAYKNIPAFHSFMHSEFGHEKPIAIKDIRLLLIPFIYGARKEYDVKVILLDRSVYGRALSAFQMMHNSGVDLATVNRDNVIEYIKKWKTFGSSLAGWVPEIPIFDLRFESLMVDTKHAISAVAEFIDFPRVPLVQAANFVDAGLARRRVAHPYINVCYGQNGEDYILWSLFDRLGYRGKYIDVGSLDGKVFSNTYSFDLANWQGLCIEAHPFFTPYLRSNRPQAHVFHAAALDKDTESVEFFAYPRGSLSTINPQEIAYLQKRFKVPGTWEKVAVPGRTLNSMLEEVKMEGPIDVVSIDVEGAELSVLRGFNIEKYNPRILVLEHLTPEKRQEVAAYMVSFGYVAAAELSNNTFYCKGEDVAKVQQARRGLNVQPIKTTHPLDVK